VLLAAICADVRRCAEWMRPMNLTERLFSFSNRTSMVR